MVDIESSGILVDPMSSRKDAKMIRAHKNLMQRLKQTNIQPLKQVLDKKISANLKELI